MKKTKIDKEDFDKEITAAVERIMSMEEKTHIMVLFAAASRIHSTLCIRTEMTPEFYEANLLPLLLEDYKINWEKYVKEIDK